MFARVEEPDGTLGALESADVSDKPEIGDHVHLGDGRRVQVTGYALDEEGHLSYLVVVEDPAG
jgi:hypothetical protein